MRLCRLSADLQLKRLQTQKSELDYYIRVHGVQDNGYQQIASLANSINHATNAVKSARHIIDSLATDKRQHHFAQIRAGKANVHILDDLRVSSYGSMVPINNVAAVTTPDSRTIAIKPWDKSMFHVIEKAIIDSTIGIMPENNGEIIRLGIPPLTEERRRQLTKQCSKEAEEAKVAIRNARRDGIDKLKTRSASSTGRRKSP